eukprot:CAMPEP_0203752574 /NCGR_PEP_ID=MMETSP0098-20131031/6483_1 /ASSEMBLY_ACC=CAM_ASM_000208 /TAXON_ID=96639 /ORGANISM=" , Strain NY0313808BC1" /LENGTH=224 /DNA_ID=CAMNT_0050642803 /DNA_START=33 /DNA_END=707 /DNA_ORIENTATION=+
MTENYEVTSLHIAEQLSQLKPRIVRLAGVLDCKNISPEIQDDPDSLSEADILKTLGVVEQRINEYLHVFFSIADVARVEATKLDGYQTFHTFTNRKDTQTPAFKAPARSSSLKRRDSGILPGAIKPAGLVSEDKSQASQSPHKQRAVVGPLFPRTNKPVEIDPPDMDTEVYDEDLDDVQDTETIMKRKDLEKEVAQIVDASKKAGRTTSLASPTLVAFSASKLS